MKKINYSDSGVDYKELDRVKKMAQEAAKKTAKNLILNRFSEIEDSRGESAYVWDQGDVYMASVAEGLGTKNLVADETRDITGKTYYDVIGHDTVASIINDLITVGAVPLTVNAYWAVGDSKFISDKKLIKDLISGWQSACDLSGVSWGGGETPTLKNIINPKTIDLAGSAVGIIKPKSRLVSEKKIREGDRIILLESNGINVNGLSLARSIADKLSQGYATKLTTGQMYGEALLTKTNIYAKLIEKIFETGAGIHYLVNITGHGLRKIMRARQNFTYVIEKVFEPQEIFLFIQKQSGLGDSEMYATFNMGQDYALFIDKKDVERVLRVIKVEGFEGIDAGYVEKGEKQAKILPKNLVFKSESFNLR